MSPAEIGVTLDGMAIIALLGWCFFGPNKQNLSRLREGRGYELKPTAWQGLSEDSHHRLGSLVFS